MHTVFKNLKENFWNFSISNIFLTLIISRFFFLINLLYIFFISIKNKFLYKLLKYRFFKKSLFFFLFFFITGLIINLYVHNSLVHQLKFLSLIAVFFFSFFLGYFLYLKKNIYISLSRLVLYFNCMLIIDIYIFSFLGFSIFPFVSDINYFTKISRYGGVFLDEMVLGGYLCITFPLIFNYLKLRLKNIDLFFYNNLNLYFFTYLLAIVFTGGRKPAVIFGIFLLIYYLFFLKSFSLKKIFTSKKLLSVFVLSSIMACILLLNHHLYQRYVVDVISILSNIKNSKIISQGDWFSIYHSSFQIIQHSSQNFIIGVGSKNFTESCQMLVGKSCSTHPHNLYIEMLVSFGLFGFLLFCTCIYKIFNFLIRLLFILKTKDQYRVISIIFIQIFFFTPFLPSGGLFATDLLIYFSILNSISVMNLLTLSNHYDFKKI